MSKSDLVVLNNEEGRKMVKELCKKHEINYAEFKDLIAAEVDTSGSQSRHGLFDSFDDILDRICEG